MVKKFRHIQRAIVLVLVLMLALPVVSFADHKKAFKEGLKYETNRQWDKAAQQFAEAAAEKPANVEYQLHLSRALVNAALMLIERGDKLADQKDYQAAYQEYRQAFSYDQSNELSLLKARKMLEALGLPTDVLPSIGDPSGPKNKPDKDGEANQKARYNVSFNGVIQPNGNARSVPAHLTAPPSRKFQETQVIYRDNSLLTIIEQLAQTMGLNVIFDSQLVNQLRTQKTSIELRNITYPRALEIILKTHNMMYVQLDTRTIVVALDGQQSRMKYEQFAVRTFYIKNADVEQMRGAIQAATQAKSLTSIKQLNALVVRDTPTNIQLIESLINTLDKSKAEVLIDVQIYEVSKNDLLQIGNQFGAEKADSAITSALFGGFGQNGNAPGTPNTHLFANTSVLGFALGLPPSSVSFFQNKGKAKLLASTQVHILDTEKQNIRIGRRVPIQTASLPSYVNPTQGNQNNQGSQFLNTAGFGVGIPQIQYENVGLNIDMEPKVFEDEVQMVMKIESTSLDLSSGRLTPTFNQRTMQSVARVKDGQPTLIAGVSQTEESKSVKGIPILGLIPILGRFFATPETNNVQSDVVITVTPHILRRADIQETDHLAYLSGTQTDPSTQLSLETILTLADALDAQKDQVASAAGAPASTPAPQTTPAAVPTQTQPQSTQGTIVNTSLPGVVVSPVPTQTPTANPVKPQVERKSVPQPGAPPKRDIDDEDEDDEDDDDDEATLAPSSAPVQVMVRGASSVATKGQDFYVGIFLNGTGAISSTNFSLTYDSNVLEIKGVRDGGLLRAGGVNPELQFTAEGGLLNVQITRPAGSTGVRPAGQLLIVVFTPKGQGTSPLTINEQQTFLRTAQGQVLPLRFQSSQVEVR
jgi:general secretion pathway protein D